MSSVLLLYTYRGVLDVISKDGAGITRPDAVGLSNLVHVIGEKNVGMAPKHLFVAVLPVGVAFAFHFQPEAFDDTVDVLLLAFCKIRFQNR